MEDRFGVCCFGETPTGDCETPTGDLVCCRDDPQACIGRHIIRHFDGNTVAGTITKYDRTTKRWWAKYTTNAIGIRDGRPIRGLLLW